MHLFVYGTLLSTVPSNMAKFLQRRAKLIGPATVVGTLHDLGMYPGFTTKGADTIVGEVYDIEADRSAQTLEMLDAYEGVTGEAEDEYVRSDIECTLSNGETLTAQTYVSVKLSPDSQPISSGDYTTFYRTNEAHQRFINGG